MPQLAFADADPTCTSYTLPVTLSANDPTIYHVFGQLCSQGSLDGKTVQFLIHGFTYDHNYWSWPLIPGKYSYVTKATADGYVTFAVDRIGSSLSDHPDGTNVTLQSNAFVIHQLVQDLRNGTISNTHFTKVVLVGHSFGSATSIYEAATYDDVDGLILSGFVHQQNPDIIPTFGNDIYSASSDPKFSNSGLGPDYLTTKPNTREELFYNLIDANSQVIALDEELKQTGTAEELSTGQAAFSPTFSQSIHVPVLTAVGQNDKLVCNELIPGLSCQDANTILLREAPDYSAQACLEAFVLPTAGHDMNLHLNAKSWFVAANDWVARRVGKDTTHPATQPCQ